MERLKFTLENVYKDIRETFYLHTVVFVILLAGMIVPLWVGSMLWNLYWDAVLSEYQDAERLIVAEYLDQMQGGQTDVEGQIARRMKTAPERVGVGAFFSTAVSWREDTRSIMIQGCTPNFWALNGYWVLEGAGPEEEWKGPGMPCYVAGGRGLYAMGVRTGDMLTVAGTEFTVAGIIKCPKLYGQIVVSYETLAFLGEGMQMQYQTLLLFEKPVKIPAARMAFSGVQQVIGVCRGQQQEKIYVDSAYALAWDRLLTGVMMLAFTAVSLLAVSSGMLAQERRRIALRQTIGARRGRLFWEYVLRMELLLGLAVLLDVLLYPKVFGSMRGMSRYLELPVIAAVWLLFLVLLFLVSGGLWHRMCRKQGTVRMLKEGT